MPLDLAFRKEIDRIIMKCNLEPMNDAVIVYVMKITQTAGGIALPDKTNNASLRGLATLGTVIAVGPGRFIDLTGQREPLGLVPGDNVIFASLAGLELGEVIRKEIGDQHGFEAIKLLRAHDIITKIRI